jgi:hypothetical protein
MELELKHGTIPHPVDIETLAASIAAVQLPSGEIPWHTGGKTDPWDHVESAIGLSIGGYIEEARRAFEWLAENQLEDGSWYSSYLNGNPEDMTRESNQSSYIAVGVFHHYLITQDRPYLEYIWPTVSAGVDYAVNLQGPGGEIYWARNPRGAVDPMSLLTGSSSVYMSLKCALVLAFLLGESRPAWQVALKRLQEAICYRGYLFNRAKSRYSMDWFYPVLSGAMNGGEAKKRIDRFWNKFVVEGLGVRCVSDNPWITMAETSELVLSLAAMRRRTGRDHPLWILNSATKTAPTTAANLPDGVICPRRSSLDERRGHDGGRRPYHITRRGSSQPLVLAEGQSPPCTLSQKRHRVFSIKSVLLAHAGLGCRV